MSRTSSRPCQSAYVDGRIVCSLCYDNGKEVKSFLIGPGIEQHLRTMHKKEKHHGIELGRKSELLTKRLHGDETMAFMTEVMKNKAVRVTVQRNDYSFFNFMLSHSLLGV